MCGIIGYTGQREATPILLSGLAALEYRGYDSAGIAVHEDSVVCIKSSGKIENLRRKLENGNPILGRCGIGHTRWATHGEPSERNAHPHISKNLALVHNGIIENYAVLREKLTKEGYSFKSDTDTEAAAHLVDFYYQKDNSPEIAISMAIKQIKGSYAFCIIFKNDKETIWAVRSGSPLLCAHTSDGSYLSSDITALLPYAKDYYQIEEKVIVKASPQEIRFFNLDSKEVFFKEHHIDWAAESAKKQGYNHFMLKEINEQETAVKNTVSPRLRDGIPHFDCEIIDRDAKKISSIKIIACGTAMHAGLIGKNLIERFSRIPVSVEVASEFRYGEPILDENTLIIAISQSGETADTLAALELAKKRGSKTLAIVNAVGSSMSREADYVIYTKAGPEISVASTKAYTVQCAVLYQMALKLALARQKITLSECQKLCEYQRTELCKAIDATLRLGGKIKRLAEKICNSKDIFFIGRGIDSLVCMEGSLKLKEISYIHSEAYPAGELKHGTISLIDNKMPVIALATVSALAEKTASNIRETQTRGAEVFCFCTKECEEQMKPVSDHLLTLPKVDELFAPVTAAIAFQLLAYYVAVLRGNDVDQPRNLAKSVTVE